MPLTGLQVGDILTKCSATVLKDGKEGQYEKEGTQLGWAMFS